MSEENEDDTFIKTVKVVVGIGVGIAILILIPVVLFFFAPAILGFLFGFADAAPTVLLIIVLIAVLAYFGIRSR